MAKRNPTNPQSELFKALTRLFSGPIINYRSQSGRRIRRQHLDKYGSRFKSASGQQFKKSIYNPLDNIATNAIANQRRVERYIDFDQMEYTPEIASTLDIYADEMTTYSSLRPMLNVKCANEEIKAVLKILFEQVLNIQYNLFGWGRTMCKYGDFFLYLDIDDKYGIKSVIALPPQEIERLEGQDATNPNYVQFQWNSGGMTFENWQVCHFRVLGNDKQIPYGTSILEPARRIWRQLTLMEDAMMAYRVARSSERRVFKIDVGAIPPQDVEQYMQKIVTQLKRHSIVDPNTGKVDLRFNPMSIEEDYFIPVRAGSVTDIQSLAGAQNITAIDDVKYYRDKLFSALKVPQSYLTMGEGATEDKTTLAQKDIRFARTIQRLQRVIIAELTKIAIIHLYTLGFRGDDLLSFELSLNNPSKIAELQELEHWKTKFDIAASATEGFFSRRWVSENIFDLSHEEIIRVQREMFYDREMDAKLQQVAESVAAAASGAGGFDLGGETAIGGDEINLDNQGGPVEMDAADAGGEAADALGGGGDEPAGGDDSTLLAVPPGSRTSPRLSKSLGNRSRTGKKYTTPGAKGKVYQKVSVDKRPDGARTRNYNSIPKPEINTFRSNNLGAPELRSLSRGIYEGKDSNYLREQQEENALLEVNDSIRTLIESLDIKEEGNKDENKA